MAVIFILLLAFLGIGLAARRYGLRTRVLIAVSILALLLFLYRK